MSYISMDSKKLVVPTELRDLTLEQYVQYSKIPEHLDDETRMSEIIHLFTGLSRGVIRKMTKKSRDKVLKLLVKAVNIDDQPLVLRTSIDSVELGFLPNLDKMTFGEFVDLENTKYEAENYEQIMRVLYRPIVNRQGEDRYDVLPYSQCLDLDLDYSKMTMDCVIGAMVFFCDLGRDLLIHTMRSLEEERKKGLVQGQILHQSGGGTDVSLTLLNQTLEELTQLRKSHYISV